MNTVMTNWLSGNRARVTLIMLSVLSLMIAAGYYGGHAAAAASTCSAIGKVFQEHHETVYDPATDSITVLAYPSDNQYQRVPMSFRADFALQECGRNSHITAHVQRLRQDYQQFEAALCASLKRVIAGEEPVPVKNGERMNMEAAKNYIATRCSSTAKTPETR